MTWFKGNRFVGVNADGGFIRFGKHRDVSLTDVVADSPDYLEWMLDNIDDLPNDVREYIEFVQSHEEDPIVSGSGQAPRSTATPSTKALLEKTRAKLAQSKQSKEKTQMAEVTERRKDEAEW